MSTISSSTTTTTAYVVTADTTGALVLQTGATPTTAVTVGTDQSVTFAQAANLPNTFGFKNRIINGAMVIDQRNAGASVTVNTSNVYSVDRFANSAVTAGSGVFSAQQVLDAPSGFVNSLKITTTTAQASLAATDRFIVRQMIEGNNVADLSFGTASAKAITLSFWVKSSLTGTFGGSIVNSASDRSYPFSYVISSANAWEYKTITIVGDTSGTWLTDTGVGIRLAFSMGAGTTYLGTASSWASGAYQGVTGQVNVISTLSATWQVTGVQLEKGSTATSFDYRPYGTELQLCQRYYYKYSSGSITLCQYRTDTGLKAMTFNLNQSMRSSPTVTINTTGGSGTFSATPYNNDSIEFVVSSASTTGRSYVTDFDSVAEL